MRYRPIAYFAGLVGIASALIGCSSADQKAPTIDSAVGGYDTQLQIVKSEKDKLEETRKSSVDKLDQIILGYRREISSAQIKLGMAREELAGYKSKIKRYSHEMEQKISQARDKKLGDEFVGEIRTFYTTAIEQAKSASEKLEGQLKKGTKTMQKTEDLLEQAIKQRRRLDPSGYGFQSLAFEQEPGYIPVPGYGPVKEKEEPAPQKQDKEDKEQKDKQDKEDKEQKDKQDDKKKKDNKK